MINNNKIIQNETIPNETLHIDNTLPPPIDQYNHNIDLSYHGDYTTDFMQDENKGIRNEISLLRAVIWQAVSDIRSNSKRPECIAAKNLAILWATHSSCREDFNAICQHAGFNPKVMRKEFKKIIQEIKK